MSGFVVTAPDIYVISETCSYGEFLDATKYFNGWWSQFEVIKFKVPLMCRPPLQELIQSAKENSVMMDQYVFYSLHHFICYMQYNNITHCRLLLNFLPPGGVKFGLTFDEDWNFCVGTSVDSAGKVHYSSTDHMPFYPLRCVEEG